MIRKILENSIKNEIKEDNFNLFNKQLVEIIALVIKSGLDAKLKDDVIATLIAKIWFEVEGNDINVGYLMDNYDKRMAKIIGKKYEQKAIDILSSLS